MENLGNLEKSSGFTQKKLVLRPAMLKLVRIQYSNCTVSVVALLVSQRGSLSLCQSSNIIILIFSFSVIWGLSSSLRMFSNPHALDS